MWKTQADRRTVALALTVLLSAVGVGCDRNYPTQPDPSGKVGPVVTTVTTGGQFDVDGYQIEIRGEGRSEEEVGPLIGVRRIDVNETLVLDALGAGRYGLVLTDVADNCTVNDLEGSWRALNGSTTRPLEFHLTCTPSIALSEMRILFGSDRSGAQALFTMRLDGSGLSQLTADPILHDWNAVLSRDGSRIAFVRSPPEESLVGLPGIYVMTIDGSRMTRVTGGWEDSPDWSPDGSRLAFRDESGLSVVKADGNDRIHLFRGTIYSPDWSPDGKLIAFGQEDEFWIVNADGTDPRRVQLGGGPAYASDWSPDGKLVAIGQPDGIWIVNADGTDPRRVGSTPGSGHPLWSPDGRRIAFTAVELTSGASVVYVMGSDGSHAVPLTHPGRMAGAWAWSPDGSQLLLTGQWRGNRDIYLVRMDGGLVRVTADPSGEWEVRLQPPPSGM